MTKVIIVDDHLLFAEGLATMLQQARLEVVALFTTPRGVLECLRSQPVDIILLDVDLEGDNGVTLCKQWLQALPFLKIIGLSMHHEHRYVAGMYKAGAKGYLFKNSGRQEILDMIETVVEGGTYFEGEVATILVSKTLNTETVELNPREKKILYSVIEGKTSRQIANELGVSIKTVEFYRNSLLVKFNVKNSIELVNKTRELFL
jgi:DNA-binding NarL/FixJ family response regulator